MERGFPNWAAQKTPGTATPALGWLGYTEVSVEEDSHLSAQRPSLSKRRALSPGKLGICLCIRSSQRIPVPIPKQATLAHWKESLHFWYEKLYA